MFIQLSKANEQGEDLDQPLYLNTENIVSVEQEGTVTLIGLVNGEERWVLESPKEVYSVCQQND